MQVWGATRFCSLTVKFNYASLFFHLTFRRIIQDMKVNLQILFRIFCKYSLIQVSCGIFHMKLYLLSSPARYSRAWQKGYERWNRTRKSLLGKQAEEVINWFMISLLQFKIYVLFQPFPSSFRNLEIFCFIFLKIDLYYFLVFLAKIKFIINIKIYSRGG